MKMLQSLLVCKHYIYLVMFAVLLIFFVGCSSPSGSEPNDDAPSGSEPSGDAPNGDEPNGDEPNGDEPNDTEPNGDAPNDTEKPIISISTDFPEVNEGAVITFTVSSNQPVTGDLNVNFAIDGSARRNEDYTLDFSVNTVTINDGGNTAIISIPTIDDSVKEDSDTIEIILEDSNLYELDTSKSATVNINIDTDDLPTVGFTTSALSLAENNLAENNIEGITLTLERSNDDILDPLEVQLSFNESTATLGDDYIVSDSVAFEQDSRTATIIIHMKTDTDEEDEEIINIKIIMSKEYKTDSTTSTAMVTIENVNLPAVSITDVSQSFQEADAESITITLKRTGDASEALEVELSTSGNASAGEDYTLITTPVTIPSGDIDAEFLLNIRDDGMVEGDENIIITIAQAATYHIDGVNNEVTITILDDPNSDADEYDDSVDVDDDNNGLIEIHNLDMLRNVHFNLAGTSYDDEEDDSADNSGETDGGPTAETDHCKTDVLGRVYLCGYELMRDLDFTDAGSYATGIINTEWRPSGTSNPDEATNAGFPGIGSEIEDSGGFTGIFDGNGHSISNLYMRNTTTMIDYSTGLFRRTDTGAKIRNLGMMSVAIYGGDESFDNVGGLVGTNNGTIIASYTSGNTDGGGSDFDYVGGLVGRSRGTIIASYATGGVGDGEGIYDYVGGLVGYNNGGTITASYATGTVDGGTGNNDRVGGLVGYNGGTITASYASGDVDGGAGNKDNVGGLVGYNFNSNITASYASGTVDGGAGADDRAGSLMGYNDGGSSTQSYGFGELSGHETNDRGGIADGNSKPNSVTDSSDLTKDNAGTEWNAADGNTLDAWDFGTETENPALKYADYDGDARDTYSCDQFPATIPGSDTPLVCGTTLLPGQRN